MVLRDKVLHPNIILHEFLHLKDVFTFDQIELKIFSHIHYKDF